MAADFLAGLGIVGWAPLEPVVLAALATESPVLLVGEHGTAKSLLVERLAGALGLVFRHYNASLVSYDDLVGIPLPAENGPGLRFVGTEGAIWGAGFVFLDEISRCRPELQNKLFPLIHERRVAGLELPELRQRWSAMNPPAPQDGDANGAAGPLYLGSEALDPALADRFAFVLRVPSWRDLCGADRLALVSGRRPADARPLAQGELARLVRHATRAAAEVEKNKGEPIADYVVRLVDLLARSSLPLSPRRGRSLARSVAAVHGARIALGHEDPTLGDSAELALRNALPQNADEVPPSFATVLAAHRQAYELASLARDDSRRKLLGENDPGRRIALAARLGLAVDALSRTVTQSLAAEPCDARRIGLATAVFLAFRNGGALTPAAWEALAQLTRRVLEPRQRSEDVATGPDLERWREIQSALARDDAEGIRSPLERSFVLAGFPDLWRRIDWRAAHARFRADLALLGAREGDS
jgi:MoxR-like ATPase